MQFIKKISGYMTLTFMALISVPLTVRADYSWNFPKPATPMALDTLHVHNKFMIIVMVIFAVVLGIMIYSIVFSFNLCWLC